MDNYEAAYLKELVDKGMYDRYGENVPPEVIDRINLEYDVIIPNHFDEYILIIWDIYNFCNSPERVYRFCEEHSFIPPEGGIIPLGPGRGSVGGSMVCYCIGIHECDPILFGLYFERFLNPERISFPDIDWDVSQRYRHIAVAYIAWKYGYEKVAQIITYGTLAAKTVILEVLKSANVPDSMITMVKKTVPEDPGVTISDIENDEKFLSALQGCYFQDTKVQVNKSNVLKILELGIYKREDPKLNAENTKILMDILNGLVVEDMITVKTSWTWEKALHVMKSLEGLNKNESTHAAGVVIAPVELESNVPLMRKSGTGVLSCQYDMKSLEAIGYLKMDSLGLRTVDVNHDAERLVRRWYDPDFSIKDIRYDDADSIKLINDGDTVGIFQIESSGFTTMMQQLDIGGYEVPREAHDIGDWWNELVRQIGQFMWISAGVALYRPGPLDAVIEGKTMVQHLIDRKSGKEPVAYLFPEEKGYLEETYGILVYQEQVMGRVRAMTGCSLGRADILRKAMGKKDPVLMKEQMDWFIDAAMKHDFTAHLQNPLHKQQLVDRAAYEIATFSRYGFNKAHTVAYAHICYHNAYFKTHYPAAFYTALLNSETENPKRQTIIIRDMLKHDVKLLPPTVNESDSEFTMVSTDTIRFGLCAIKNIGGRATDSIFIDRNTRGSYKSVAEFRARVPSTDCNKTGMANLAKCGAFDDMLVPQFDCRATLVESMEAICENVGKIKKKKNKVTAAPTVDEILVKLPSVTYPITKAEDDPIQYSVWEKEILKYYISGHPIDAYVDEIRRWTAIEDTEMEDLPSEFYIAGFIEACHETVIKKEGRNLGKKMGFVTVGTQYRTYEATMFPGIYESCLPYIKTGEPVVLKGKRDSYKDSISIQALYIRSMSNGGIRDCPECHIRMDNPTYQQLIELKSLFSQHYGATKVFIHTLEGYNDMVIECGQTIALNDHIIDYIESIAELSYKPN
jgi:DNA polymerase III subunit alpha